MHNKMIIEVPDDIAANIQDHCISTHAVHSFVIGALEAWQRVGFNLPKTEMTTTLPFSGSATQFIDRLICDNRDLFERLARP